MKAPVWGMCCAVVCSAIFGIGVALHVAGQLRAADSMTVTTIGPEAPQLSRPSDGSGKLDYSNPAAWQPNGPVSRSSSGATSSSNATSALPSVSVMSSPTQAISNGLRQPVGAMAPAQLPSNFNGAPRQLSAAPVGTAFDPQQPAPIDGINENNILGASGTDQANQVSSRNTSRNIQTAYGQPADLRLPPQNSNSSTNQPMQSGGRPAPANPSVVVQGGQAPSSMRLDGIQPSTTAMVSDMPGPGGMMTLSGSNQEGVTPVIPRSDCGCGNGMGGGCGALPPGQYDCPNCGGWQRGMCSNHNPEGSCILERLACCMCKPYPDCSNGCVDFCHSWIHHEDECWCTSNHKCCAEGCGPYPYGGCPNDGQGKGVGCGCGNCGPCVPPPDVYFAVEGFALHRDNDTNRQDIVTGGTVLNTGDFDFNFETGPRITVGVRPTKIDAWEITYFGLNEWDDPHVLTGTGNLSLPGDLGAAAGLNFTGADSMVVNYSSEIHSAEFNYIWHERDCECRHLSFLVGFRYFHLDEDLDMFSTVTGVGSSFYNTHIDNDLFGAQIGLRCKHCCKKWTLESYGKAGAYGDSIVDKQVVANVDETPIRNVDFGHGRWSFVGELGVTASYHLCDCMEVMAGYSAIFVDGVALAPDQLDFTNTPTSGHMLVSDGNLFLHGGHAGIAVRW
jgi:Putative beta barrel porin-7 (BBP7)